MGLESEKQTIDDVSQFYTDRSHRILKPELGEPSRGRAFCGPILQVPDELRGIRSGSRGNWRRLVLKASRLGEEEQAGSCYILPHCH